MARPVAVTVGDPAGIGPEVVVAALASFLRCHALPVHLICSESLLARTLEFLAATGRGDLAATIKEHLGTTLTLVAPVASHLDVRGQWHDGQAPFIAESLELGIARAQAGAALVTGPSDKRFFVRMGLSQAGHTEFLAQRFPGHEPLMLFEASGFRIAVLTRHIPLSQVTEAVTASRLAQGAAIAWSYVTTQEASPRPMAIAALDPHCGEWGAFSSVDLQVKEWVQGLTLRGLDLTGPLAADTLFVPRHLPNYSAVLCWYHDQGMIPIKLLRFDRAVNVTLGLPVLRVSPAHGVAYDIAWRGRANAGSCLAALCCAAGVPAPEEPPDKAPFAPAR